MQVDIIGLSIGIFGIAIGIVVSYYFYRKSIFLKEPCWSVRSNNLIEGFKTKLENLRIYYSESQIENLTISKILFWNDGRVTIDRKDLETVNRLRISGKEGVKFLDVKLLALNNQSSQFNAHIADNGECVYLDFDYLDHEQGSVIQVIHTGTSSNDIQIIGDIKGVKSLRNRKIIPKWEVILQFPFKLISKYRKPYFIFSTVLGVCYSVLGIASFFIPSIISTSMVQGRRIIYSLITVFVGLFLVFLSMNRLRGHLIAPRGLEILDEGWS